MIDYKTQSNSAETTLQDFIKGQQERSMKDIAGTRQNVESARSPLFQAAMGMGNDPAAFQEQMGLANQRLGNSLNQTLARRGMDASKSSLGNQYNELVRQATQRNATLGDAQSYARQNLQQTIQQQQQAQSLQRQIEQANQKQSVSEDFANQGLSQEQDFAQNPNDLYQQAMYRALFGLVGSGATLGGYALMNRQPQTQPNLGNLNAYSGIGPQQNQGYYPQKPSFLY